LEISNTNFSTILKIYEIDYKHTGIYILEIDNKKTKKLVERELRVEGKKTENKFINFYQTFMKN
jgi:hypothetical protein